CTEDDGTVQQGQDAVGAVAVSWRTTASCSTVKAVRCTVLVEGSKALISVWSSWVIIFHNTALLRLVPLQLTKNDEDPRGHGQVWCGQRWNLHGSRAPSMLVGSWRHDGSFPPNPQRPLAWKSFISEAMARSSPSQDTPAATDHSIIRCHRLS